MWRSHPLIDTDTNRRAVTAAVHTMLPRGQIPVCDGAAVSAAGWPGAGRAGRTDTPGRHVSCAHVQAFNCSGYLHVTPLPSGMASLSYVSARRRGGGGRAPDPFCPLSAARRSSRPAASDRSAASGRSLPPHLGQTGLRLQRAGSNRLSAATPCWVTRPAYRLTRQTCRRADGRLHRRARRRTARRVYRRPRGPCACQVDSPPPGRLSGGDVTRLHGRTSRSEPARRGVRRSTGQNSVVTLGLLIQGGCGALNSHP